MDDSLEDLEEARLAVLWARWVNRPQPWLGLGVSRMTYFNWKRANPPRRAELMARHRTRGWRPNFH